MKRLHLAVVVVVGLGVAGVMSTAVRAKDSDKNETKVGDTEFTAYEGSQSWPKGKGGGVNKDYAVPIYIGLPDKSFKVLGRISDKRVSGFDVVGRGFDEAFEAEKHRMRNCANQAKQHEADAIIVTDDENAIKAFNLSKKEVRESAPLFDHKHSLVLAVKF
jgi:hypothetical protein